MDGYRNKPRQQTARGKPHGAGVHSLSRALSKLGAASRTQAETLIRNGSVTVDGQRVTDPNLRVNINTAVICIDGERTVQARLTYLMLNKPRGLVTTARDEHGRDTVYTCLPRQLREWIAPVGRLDKASEGLLLFTNDTIWANRLLDPASHLPRVYHVQIDRKLSPTEIACLLGGITDDTGEPMRAKAVEVLRAGSRNCWLAVTLIEGRNRQIRRMLATLGAGVLRLVRVSIGNLELGMLGKGQTRELTDVEVVDLGR